MGLFMLRPCENHSNVPSYLYAQSNEGTLPIAENDILKFS